jgi:uncharacterized protein
MIYKLSDFCHCVESENGLVALFNSLTLGVIIVKKEIARTIYNAKDKILSQYDFDSMMCNDNIYLIDELIKNKIIFPIDQSLDMEDYLMIRNHLNQKKIGILYLLLSDNCNLKCNYCYIENSIPNHYKFSNMSKETAFYGIDLFAKSLNDSCGISNPQIILYGGEPFLNFEVMKDSILYIEKLKDDNILPNNTLITINTNGTLIEKKHIDFFKNKANISIALSIDGQKNINDICRVYHNNLGTYDNIIKAYKLLIENNINVGLCCTINKYNVANLLEISKWFISELKIESIGFNLIIEGVNIDKIRGDKNKYAEEASNQIIECFKLFREHGVYEDRIMRKVNSFIDGTIYFYDCGGCGQQLVISPDGYVGVCQGYCGDKKYFVKPDNDFNPLEHDYWNLWRHRSPLFMKQCYNCIALSICGGGCPFGADLSKGSIWELDDTFCLHAKKTTVFLIKELINNCSREK